MGCGCHNAETTERAEARAVSLVVRDGSHPLACEACLEKHLGQALVYATEWREDTGREAEHALCAANLGCAGEHARALGKTELAAAIKAARLAFQGQGDVSGVEKAVELFCGGYRKVELRLEAIGHLGVAEQMMRLCGSADLAERVRALRREFAGLATSPGTP